MSATPLLTVAVAMFQAHDTIHRALRSIYDQEFLNYEVVIVDDGSTDQSVGAASAIDHPDVSVRVISHETNQGLGPARNTAVAHARGEYVVFVDSDDEMLPGALDAIAAVAQSSVADVLLLGTVENKRGRDRPLHDPEMLTALATSTEPWNVTSHPHLLMSPPSTWSKAFRREFLIDNTIEFPPGYHQDVPSSTEALLRARYVGAVDHLCYRYIRGEAGSSATLSKGTKTLVRIAQIQRIRERTDITSLPIATQQYLSAMVAVHLIWGNRAAYRTMPGELHEQFFHDSCAELHEWFGLAKPTTAVRSEPLMPTKERELFSVALLSDSFRLWKHALATHQKRLRWQRRFDLRRYGPFKSSPASPSRRRR
jgi:glycosyltransferase involved in cell wall biosynthesis